MLCMESDWRQGNGTHYNDRAAHIKVKQFKKMRARVCARACVCIGVQTEPGEVEQRCMQIHILFISQH